MSRKDPLCFGLHTYKCAYILLPFGLRTFTSTAALTTEFNTIISPNLIMSKPKPKTKTKSKTKSKTRSKSKSKPQKHALLIGIDYYIDPNKTVTTRRYDGNGDEMPHPNLNGCVNDILSIEEHLISNLDFKKGKITKLLAPHPNAGHGGLGAKEPTYQNIIQSLERLCLPTVSNSGDFVYIHYSGHGARAKTVFPTLKQTTKKDGSIENGSIEDEVLVPVNIFRGGKYIRDLEFGFLLQKLIDHGLVLTVVLDCCHSGGAVRGDEGLVRGTSKVYESEAKRDTPKSIAKILQMASASQGWLDGLKGCVVLAACQPSELARETKWNGKPSGILTSCLMRSIDQKAEDITSQALYDRVRKKMEHCENQVPLLIGESSRYFFRAESIRSGLSVTQVDLDKGRVVRNSRLRLFGTTSTVVMPNSIYAILPPAFDLNHPVEESDILARVKILRHVNLESEALCIEVKKYAWEQIKEGCTASLEVLPSEKQFRVDVSEAVKERVANFEKIWISNKGNNLWLRLSTQNPDTQPVRFTIQAGMESNAFEIEDHAGEFVQAFYDNLDSLPFAKEESIPLLIRRLEHIARFLFIREMKSPVSSLADQLSIGMDSMSTNGILELSTGSQKTKTKDGPHKVRDGEEFNLVLSNKSMNKMGFALLDFCTEFGIEQVWPQGQGFREILPHQDQTIETTLGIPPHLEKHASQQGGVYETLKLFVVMPPTHLTMLRVPTLQGLESPSEHRGEEEENYLTPVDWYELLEQGDIPLRGAKCRDVVDHWQAVNIPFRIIPRTMEQSDDASA